DRKRATIDERSRSCGCESARMANRTTDAGEQRITASCGCRYRLLTTRSTCRRHEIGKRQHLESVIFRILYGIESPREGRVDSSFSGAGRVLVCAGVGGAGTASAETVKRVGDTHLVEISIARKRHETRMLCLPTKATNT